ncbi:hypothetical protein [Roseateles asaccharophilus]|uniref:Uncharacterized protein n=1 Tax=Roseateles asaccharophilus TaxID=582607 RepID=A0ABU2A6N6_9BURK|nr:hypothetical protein [Roseateles asaccharophilus]MDR7332858.1 hypothetical protein [Roseateles asaccharophilus]
MAAGTATHDVHWIEVIDAQGIHRLERLGPYATALLGQRACRGVTRLLNTRRYTAAVVSQQDLESRNGRAGLLRS